MKDTSFLFMINSVLSVCRFLSLSLISGSVKTTVVQLHCHWWGVNGECSSFLHNMLLLPCTPAMLAKRYCLTIVLLAVTACVCICMPAEQLNKLLVRHWCNLIDSNYFVLIGEPSKWLDFCDIHFSPWVLFSYFTPLVV